MATMIGRPTAEISLTQAEREALEAFRRRRKTAQAVSLRSAVVLACAEGLNNGEVAEQLGIARQTVGKWRARFARDRKSVV